MLGDLGKEKAPFLILEYKKHCPESKNIEWGQMVMDREDILDCFLTERPAWPSRGRYCVVDRRWPGGRDTGYFASLGFTWVHCPSSVSFYL